MTAQLPKICAHWLAAPLAAIAVISLAACRNFTNIRLHISFSYIWQCGQIALTPSGSHTGQAGGLPCFWGPGGGGG